MARIIITLIALGVASSASAETYRLVHAIGNTEKHVAKNLSKSECESRKEELKAVASGLGTGGSVTCLPESIF